MIFHKHNFKISSHYQEPKGVESFSNLPPELVTTVLYGQTTITKRCLKCNKLQPVEIVPGRISF